MYWNLRKEMRKAKITQADIGRMLGLSRQVINYRFNNTSALSLEEAIKIRDAFFPNMTLDYLFTEDD